MTEFRQFLETLRRLGVAHQIYFGGLPKIPWQAIISGQGYNLTSLACLFVEVERLRYVFSTGQAHWVGDVGYGPEGVLLFSIDEQEKISPRRLFKPGNGEEVLGVQNVRALARQYGFEDAVNVKVCHSAANS